MNLQTIEFHQINLNNVALLFKPYDSHYKSMGAIACLRRGLTELAEYMRDKAESVYYAKINNGTQKFEENFSLCVNHHLRMSVKSESKKGSVQSNAMKPFSSLKVFNDFVADMENHADKEMCDKISTFFNALILSLGKDYVLELHYGHGEFDFIGQNPTIGHSFEIYLELLTH